MTNESIFDEVPSRVGQKYYAVKLYSVWGVAHVQELLDMSEYPETVFGPFDSFDAAQKAANNAGQDLWFWHVLMEDGWVEVMTAQQSEQFPLEYRHGPYSSQETASKDLGFTL